MITLLDSGSAVLADTSSDMSHRFKSFFRGSGTIAEPLRMGLVARHLDIGDELRVDVQRRQLAEVTDRLSSNLAETMLNGRHEMTRSFHKAFCQAHDLATATDAHYSIAVALRAGQHLSVATIGDASAVLWDGGTWQTKISPTMAMIGTTPVVTAALGVQCPSVEQMGDRAAQLTLERKHAILLCVKVGLTALESWPPLPGPVLEPQQVLETLRAKLRMPGLAAVFVGG